MSSRHHKHKSSSRSSTKRSDYPTRWSEWEWDPGNGCESRYRQKSRGEYEYEYRREDPNGESSNTVAASYPAAQSGPSTYADDPSQLYSSQYAPPLGSLGGNIYEEQPLDSPYPPTTGFAFENPNSLGISSGIADIGSGLDTLSIASPSNTQQADRLDQRYIIIDQPSRFFQIGKVFKTLWTEPASGTMNDSQQGTLHTVAFGQSAYSKIRRFVVIRKRLHCSLCLPILTYGGQGATKPGVRASDHGIVYPANEDRPLEAPGESLGKHALGVVIEEPGETLDRMSRIDYGKVYTVQHNIKVMNVGRIENAHMRYLKRDYKESMGIESEDED